MKVNIKASMAELFGAALLTLAVLIFPDDVLPKPVAVALTLGLIVATIGYISGAHVNPALTFAAWLNKKIDGADALVYVFAQFLGAGLAIVIASLFTDLSFTMDAENTFEVFLAEVAGTAILAFGFGAAVYGKERVSAPFVVGGSLLLGIVLASLGSNGILNPAVAVGAGSISLMYLVAPFVGAAIGMFMHRAITLGVSVKSMSK